MLLEKCGGWLGSRRVREIPKTTVVIDGRPIERDGQTDPPDSQRCVCVLILAAHVDDNVIYTCHSISRRSSLDRGK
jgi:hypothetical protein